MPNKWGEDRNEWGVKISGKFEKWGGQNKIEHKGLSKLGITVLGQAGQVECDNGPKNIPVLQSY